MGQTIAEKILSRNNLAGVPVTAGDLIDARLDGVMVTIGQWGFIREAFRKMGFDEGPPEVFDPAKVFLMVEHNQPPRTLERARIQLEARRDAARLGLKHFYDSQMGICHQIMFDKGHVRPGELIVGTDSHTITYGALNAMSTSVGAQTVAFAFALGELWFTVPETIKITLSGTRPNYPFAKDVMLYMAGKYSDSFALNKAIEYTGPLAGEMTLDDRMTMSDHGVEVGAQFALFSADDKTLDYVRERSDVPFEPVDADADATYAQQIDIDVDEIGFQVAKPWRFDNVVPVHEVAGIKIDQARVGSCANGRFEDIEIVARMVKGRKVAPGVLFYVSPASLDVFRRCAEAGFIATMLEAGVQVQQPGCGICGSQFVLNEETCITSTTRNYRGRMGGADCAEAQLYLASPATVTASALTGRITDPREVMHAWA